MKKIINYLLAFIITITILVIIQNIIIRIPNKYIEKNMYNTIEYYKNRDYHTILIENENNTDTLNSSLEIDDHTDCLTFNMLWNSNTNNSIKSQILMKYYFDGREPASYNLEDTVVNKVPANVEYSRYWHGSIIYIKPLLLFFDVKGIKIINIIIFTILMLYLNYLIFKKDKKISIIFFISLLTVMPITITQCFEYFFVFIIMLLSSIFTIKTLDKENKYFFYNMIITGISTCFFDFLTCETLTITIPLMLRLLLKKEKINKETFLFIVKSTFLWGISYILTFFLKWLISLIIIGDKYIAITASQASIRIKNIYKKNIIIIVMTLITQLFPISLFSFKDFIIIFYIASIVLLYIISLSKEKKKEINFLLLISLIPVVRLTILLGHTIGHYFFDYRALLPLVIVSILILIEGVQYEINNFNTLLKRRKNNSPSNKNGKKLYKKKSIN